MSRLYISAAHKSSGKTTVSIGLCAALRQQGKTVQAFKKGPDYIDPHWLARATGRSCYNLDFYTMDHDEILRSVAQHSIDADIGLIEGNKGLYDGLDLDGSNSNAALAALTDTPVILVLDARGMTRGIAPLILGYQAFDSSINIAGVILNQLGGSRHESKLRNVIEHYTDVKVVGAIHRDDQFDIDERHLGLVPSHEDPFADKKITMLADAINRQVDLHSLLDIANTTTALSVSPATSTTIDTTMPEITIGVIKSAAFGFYYADDLERFSQLGATIVEIDVNIQTSLPKVDGLFIGGGFPETHLSQLESNGQMRSAIRQAIEDGLPVYAECGGLMYLANSIQWQDRKHDMVQIIPGDIVMEKKPQGRGYVQLEYTDSHPWGKPTEQTLSAHEFHYSRFINLDKDAKFAFRVRRGTGIDGINDGFVYNNLLACYSHQRHTAANPWVSHFVEFVRSTL